MVLTFNNSSFSVIGLYRAYRHWYIAVNILKFLSNPISKEISKEKLWLKTQDLPGCASSFFALTHQFLEPITKRFPRLRDFPVWLRPHTGLPVTSLASVEFVFTMSTIGSAWT